MINLVTVQRGAGSYVDNFSSSTATVNSVLPPPVPTVFSSTFNSNCKRLYYTVSVSSFCFLSSVTPLGVISEAI